MYLYYYFLSLSVFARIHIVTSLSCLDTKWKVVGHADRGRPFRVIIIMTVHSSESLVTSDCMRD